MVYVGCTEYCNVPVKDVKDKKGRRKGKEEKQQTVSLSIVSVMGHVLTDLFSGKFFTDLVVNGSNATKSDDDRGCQTALKSE